MNPDSTTPPNHQQLYEIAEQQAGYFTAAQAQAVGFSRPLLSDYTKAERFSRWEVLIEHQLIVDARNTFGDQICAILRQSKYHRNWRTGQIEGYGKNLLP